MCIGIVVLGIAVGILSSTLVFILTGSVGLAVLAYALSAACTLFLIAVTYICVQQLRLCATKSATD